MEYQCISRFQPSRDLFTVCASSHRTVSVPLIHICAWSLSLLPPLQVYLDSTKYFPMTQRDDYSPLISFWTFCNQADWCQILLIIVSLIRSRKYSIASWLRVAFMLEPSIHKFHTNSFGSSCNSLPAVIRIELPCRLIKTTFPDFFRFRDPGYDGGGDESSSSVNPSNAWFSSPGNGRLLTTHEANEGGFSSESCATEMTKSGKSSARVL